MFASSTELTTFEQSRLEACEQVIERGLATFVDVGTALLEVRDSRLYRAEFATFEAYCAERWGLKQSRAYQLIDAAKALTNLKSSTIVELPANEAQARELTQFTPDEQRAVWQMAVETAPNGKVTAAHVRAAARINEALQAAPEAVQDVVQRFGVGDADTIHELARLHKQRRDTFDEIAASGYVQLGDEDEAVPLTAGALAIAEAIRLKAEYHKRVARDVRNATEDSAASEADRASQATGGAARYGEGAVVLLGDHLLICSDNRSELVLSILEDEGAALAFCDPPYNAQVAEWDAGNFEWQQDFLIDYADIVAVTPGIGNMPDFFRRTTMPYKWSVSAHISNGMTRGALGFGNWIYTALFSSLDSIHRNRQDITAISIHNADADQLGAKRQKPSRYLAWLFGLLTNEGDIIIDAFGGSGNSIIVAHEMGRRCICIERDVDTFNALVARASAAIGEMPQLMEAATNGDPI